MRQTCVKLTKVHLQIGNSSLVDFEVCHRLATEENAGNIRIVTCSSEICGFKMLNTKTDEYSISISPNFLDLWRKSCFTIVRMCPLLRNGVQISTIFCNCLIYNWIILQNWSLSVKKKHKKWPTIHPSVAIKNVRSVPLSDASKYH